MKFLKIRGQSISLNYKQDYQIKKNKRHYTSKNSTKYDSMTGQVGIDHINHLKRKMAGQ